MFGNPDLPESSGFDFIALEADVLDQRVGDWFGTLFLAVGAVSLFAAALGIVDYVAGCWPTSPTPATRAETRSGPRAGCTSRSCGRWSPFGSAILLLGFDQPLVLITISTVLGGAIMFVYTCLLMVTNRRFLPDAIQLRGYRLGVLVFAVLMLGTTTAIVAVDQFGNLL